MARPSDAEPDLPPLLVVPWRDPVVEALGFDPRTAYVERFWLPLLGPTATWLMRRLAAEFDHRPEGFSLDAADCARSIGPVTCTARTAAGRRTRSAGAATRPARPTPPGSPAAS